MSLLIRIIGALWAAMGFYTCFAAGKSGGEAGGSEAVTGMTVMFATLLFVLPGLALYALGSMMQRKKERAQMAVVSQQDAIAAAVSQALANERAKQQ